MPASIPTRHGRTFTSRAAIRLLETFSRTTITPFSSGPIICRVFLPVSIPMVWTAIAFVCFDITMCSSCFEAPFDLAELGFGGGDPEATGRPSYHPSILLKLYIYGYLN